MGQLGRRKGENPEEEESPAFCLCASSVSETERKRERREFNSRRRRFTQEKIGRKIQEDFFKTILNLMIKT